MSSYEKYLQYNKYLLQPNGAFSTYALYLCVLLVFISCDLLILSLFWEKESSLVGLSKINKYKYNFKYPFLLTGPMSTLETLQRR